jgi:hypothetical protein
MSVITNLWPIGLVNSAAHILCGALLLNLCPSITLAQEPAANTESSVATNETSSSSRSSEAPLYPSRDIRDKSLIAKAIDDEVQWLDTEYGKILALYRPTEAKTTHGVLILFHATETPQSWPSLLENLRAQLPRHGWETLAISLPQKYPTAIPARPSSSSASESISSIDTETAAKPTDTASPEPASASSSSSSSISASSAVARDLLIEAYINAALGFLKEKGQLNTVILADNSSVYLVLQTLSSQIQVNNRDPTIMDGPLQALVITNLQNQEPLNRAELEEVFAAPQLPVLDIFFSPDNPGQKESRDLHRAVAMRKKLDEYQQLLMDTQPKLVERDHQSYLLGRVRGFMQRQASGTETKASEEDKQDE